MAVPVRGLPTKNMRADDRNKVSFLRVFAAAMDRALDFDDPQKVNIP